MGGGMAESVLFGAAIGIGVVLLFALFGMTRKANFTEPARRGERVPTTLAPAEALARIRGLAGQGYSVAQEDPGKGMIVLADKLSLMSFGNFYPIFARDGEVIVGISPKVPQYGPVVGSKLRKITEAVKGALGA